MSGRPTTPASPKNIKVKSPVPGSPMFGCGMATQCSVSPYHCLIVPRACTTPSQQEPRGHEQLDHALQANPPQHLRCDTHRPPNLNTRGPTRYNPYLELPLPTMSHDRVRGRSIETWNQEAAPFLLVALLLLSAACFANPGADVDSRSGCLYCQMCDDFVWDPTLEELRVRKIGTGSFSGKRLCTEMHQVKARPYAIQNENEWLYL